MEQISDIFLVAVLYGFVKITLVFIISGMIDKIGQQYFSNGKPNHQPVLDCCR